MTNPPLSRIYPLNRLFSNLHPATENQRRDHSTEALRAELKELHDEGAADMVEESMPEAAHVIRHYEEFLKLLDEE